MNRSVTGLKDYTDNYCYSTVKSINSEIKYIWLELGTFLEVTICIARIRDKESGKDKTMLALIYVVTLAWTFSLLGFNFVSLEKRAVKI